MSRRPARCASALLLAVLAALTLGVVLRRQIAVVIVSGESMQPTFRSGDRILIRRTRLGRLRAGRVVVVERPSEASGWRTSPPHWPGRSRDWMIKRVAALPGDPTPALSHPAPGFPATLAPKGDRVPPGKFVVLGDNPAGSYDSRVFGYCPADRLLGVVVCPLSRTSDALTGACAGGRAVSSAASRS